MRADKQTVMLKACWSRQTQPESQVSMPKPKTLQEHIFECLNIERPVYQSRLGRRTSYLPFVQRDIHTQAHTQSLLQCLAQEHINKSIETNKDPVSDCLGNSQETNKKQL